MIPNLISYHATPYTSSVSICTLQWHNVSHVEEIQAEFIKAFWSLREKPGNLLQRNVNNTVPDQLVMSTADSSGNIQS